MVSVFSVAVVRDQVGCGFYKLFLFSMTFNLCTVAIMCTSVENHQVDYVHMVRSVSLQVICIPQGIAFTVEQLMLGE